MNLFSLLDLNFRRIFFDGASDSTTRESLVTHPREVKDSNEPSGRAGHAPTIEGVCETAQAHGSNANEAVIVDEVDEDVTVIHRKLLHTCRVSSLAFPDFNEHIDAALAICSFFCKDTSRSQAIRPVGLSVEKPIESNINSCSIKQNIRLPLLTTTTAQNPFLSNLFRGRK
ncbi:hypothetical protein Goklo_014606 [Gossypium klotzschianum]|uniref:Uncharacterized protein n=1 Tax=Gossypium klotzschianum TaxID=34286 RepID=A0A7J8U8L3_9ROSI|nr:hypothetical protein [Gossypium klotzschianum]